MDREIIVLSQPTAVSMADEWFDIASVDHFWMKWRFREISRRLTRHKLLDKGGRYLEIGCGHGAFLAQSDSVFDIILDGCDLNLGALKKVGSVKGDIFVYDISSRQPGMTGKYRGIFLLDVIEHIESDVDFMMASLACVEKGSLVVINVPALNWLFSKYDLAAGHKRRYSRSALLSLLDRCGVEPVDVSHWGFLMIPLAVARKLYLRTVSPNRIIEKGFKPTNELFNKVMIGLMELELFLFKRAPIGTSLIAIGRKR